jgi:hypothetical protein
MTALTLSSSAGGEVLSISIPRNETAVIQYFQERMPHGLFVRDETVSDVPWPFGAKSAQCGIVLAARGRTLPVREGALSPI